MPWEDFEDSLISYCRVSGDSDDEDSRTIKEAYYTAAAYLAGAGVPEPTQKKTHRWYGYLQMLKYLVLDMYDRRDIKEPNNESTENPTFRHLLNQQKWLPEDSQDSPAGGVASDG